MAIKEKVMKAWADETVIEVMPKVGTFQSPGVGEVIFVSEGKALFAIWSAERRSRLEYRVDDIADIRFVGEGAEDFGAWSMLIGVAKENDLRVSVVTKHSALPEAKTDVGRFVEINCNGEYSLLAREQGDKISIYHNIIVSMTFLRDEPGSPTDDVSKQRWKWLRFKMPLCEDILCIPDQDGKRGQRLAIRASATDAQVAVIEAAPEMLDVLSELELHIDDTEGAYPPDQMVLMLKKKLFQRVHDAIAKARGGDSA